MKRTSIIRLLLFLGTLFIFLIHFRIGNVNNFNYSYAVKDVIAKSPDETSSQLKLDHIDNSESYTKMTPLLSPTSTSTTHTINIKPDFSNVIFIGDSITFGFIKSANTPVNKDHVYAKIGAHVYEGSKLLGNNSELITKRCNGSVDYIFLMFGANDFGYNMSDFKKWYTELINDTKKMFPNANIVIQSVMPMNSTHEKPNRDQEPQKLNNVIKTIATAEHIKFLDVSTSIPNARNLLEADGLHFKKELYPLWLSV
ncbi:MAG: GDSL-type esterase/lipase family protein, partial [Bacillota bacterium]|nr:GDSL-type esterase/lipase family protein [Bacillota bacterium]